MRDEKKLLTILNPIIFGLVILIASIVGKLYMMSHGDTWLSFNGPALGIVFVGFNLWVLVRGILIRKWLMRI